MLPLNFGIKFNDLYSEEGLQKVSCAFSAYSTNIDISVNTTDNISEKITLLAPVLEGFIAELFNIKTEVAKSQKEHLELEALSRCKKLFVQRRVLADQIDSAFDVKKIQELLSPGFTQMEFAKCILALLENEQENKDKLIIAKQYALHAITAKTHSDWVIFQTPSKKNYDALIDVEEVIESGIKILKVNDAELSHRDGFSLTHKKASKEEILDQAHYCIFCHKQNKDSCSKGLRDQNNDIKNNNFSDPISGCPLDEKISEMNMLKSQGYLIGSLAAAIIDNPMVAATGERICNDCAKACIYQKQTPVNIPKIETGVLDAVLALPYGFEIYSLLTRWNPLGTSQTKALTGYKVLVVGLGPAGFTLAHYLLNEGHTVVAIDGTKIEPLPASISGINETGDRVAFEPIKNVRDLFEDLDERSAYGFGGVMEYGITVRWNKNYLKIIRLLLERRANFRMYGGVRFGSQITYSSAFSELEFDHIALAQGAGKPNILGIPRALELGMKTASDFLMSLQLSNANNRNSLASLQIRLPIVVIGGGLTAIDTATESAAYYVRQVEKFKSRYSEIELSEMDSEIAEEFLVHAKHFEDERALSKQEGRKPNFIKIIKEFGGVKVLYRKNLIDSPSYRLNHEELQLALQEGIEFVPNCIPLAVSLDKHGYLSSIKVMIDTKEVEIAAKTALMAIGTSPNTVLAKEDPEHFSVKNGYFNLNDPRISIFGDLDKKYAGNVVKAMASAKYGYGKITQNLNTITAMPDDDFFTKLDDLLLAHVVEVNTLAEHIIEIIVHAPLAARNFKPGQFFKLQNYSHSLGSKPHFESIALTGAEIKGDLISLILLETGASSDACKYLRKGEHVVLMGPTGTPTKITSKELVVLIGGGLGNAVLFSIGKAFKDAGSKVLYFAGYRSPSQLFKMEKIEECADQVVWCSQGDEICPRRPSDIAFKGNVVEAITAYVGAKNMFDIKLSNRTIAIGSDKMMAAINALRDSKIFANDATMVASINSPMQCMMKEICATCLQKHVDPESGVVSYVYSCTNQDQDMKSVDFDHLSKRLMQNSLSEKVTAKWAQKLRTGMCEETN